MNTIYKLFLKLKGERKNICFGIPNEEDELEKMFLLRSEVYKKRGYININSKSDKDEYDKNGKYRKGFKLDKKK